MPDASPTKWHRAHTTWFFEQFLLKPHAQDYREFDERFAYLFNSYYVAAGPRHARPERGLITRPNAQEVAAYRAHVDRAVERADRKRRRGDAGADRPDRRDRPQSRAAASGAAAHRHPARLRAESDQPGLRRELAAAARRDGGERVRRSAGRHPSRSAIDGDGFCFDNEQPAHQVLLQRRRDRAASRHQRRMARVHGRRRLRDAVAVAVRRLGRGRGRRLGRAGLLARGRRRLASR